MTIARDAFSAIAAGAIVVALLFQIFVNVGMTIGLAPITGIPLPVRQRRRLVADHEPRRDGRAARDRRARRRDGPPAAFAVRRLDQAAAGLSFARLALTARSRCRRRAQAQGSTSLYLVSLCPRVASRYSNQASASSMSSSSYASRFSSGTAATSRVADAAHGRSQVRTDKKTRRGACYGRTKMFFNHKTQRAMPPAASW